MKINELLDLYSEALGCDKDSISVEEIEQLLYQIRRDRVMITIEYIDYWIKNNLYLEMRSEDEIK